jgi:hypothetical protein
LRLRLSLRKSFSKGWKAGSAKPLSLSNVTPFSRRDARSSLTDSMVRADGNLPVLSTQSESISTTSTSLGSETSASIV